MSKDITKKYGGKVSDPGFDIEAPEVEYYGDYEMLESPTNKIDEVKTLANVAKILDITEDYSDVDSNKLCNMTKNLTVKIEIGTVNKNMVTITIPPPTKKDKKWAGKTFTFDKDKRAKEFLKAVESNNIWRIAYTCTIFRESDFNTSIFNVNHGYYHRWGDDNKTLLSVACYNGDKPIIALLLGCDGIDVNNDYGTGNYYKPLKSALVGNSKSTQDILEMLCCFDLEKVHSFYTYAPTKTLRDVLQTIMDRDSVNKQEENTQVALPAPTVVSKEITAITENGAVWKKLDDSSICKLTGDGDFRLRKVFNFISSTVTESHEHFDSDGKLVLVTPPALVRATSRKEIVQAQDILKRMNGSTNGR